MSLINIRKNNFSSLLLLNKKTPELMINFIRSGAFKKNYYLIQKEF